MKAFKPNLIPNNPKDNSFDRDAIIKKNGGYDKYLITLKKDGCRLQLIEGKVLTRSLKAPKSKLVIERFQPIADEFSRLNIAADGEFYMHGQKFNSIFRFFSKEDVTCPKHKAKLEKEFSKNPEKFAKDYDGLDIDFLTNFHDGLKFYLFDGFLTDRPEITGFADRMKEIEFRLIGAKTLINSLFLSFPIFHEVQDEQGLENLFNTSLSNGYEGLVLTHRDHEYKFGRNTLNEGTLLKMKDDAIEYDGVVIDVLEGSQVKDGVETTTNELGRSVTSKKKNDRENSGLAKGFLVEYEDKGTFIVGLKDFDNEAKADLLKNKDQIIGRHFRYTAMKPVKDFPRHSYFQEWRDEK